MNHGVSRAAFRRSARALLVALGVVSLLLLAFKTNREPIQSTLTASTVDTKTMMVSVAMPSLHPLNDDESSATMDQGGSYDSDHPHLSSSLDGFDFVPPPWIQSYIKFHNDHVRHDNAGQSHLQEPTTQFLQYTCRHGTTAIGKLFSRCGGLGDRLKGILMGLLYSMVDQRVYLVNWEEDASSSSTSSSRLSTYLAPAYIDWSARPSQQLVNDNGNQHLFDNLVISTNHLHPFLENPCLWHSNATGVYYLNNNLKSQKKMNATCVQQFFRGIQQEEDKLMWHSVFWTLFRFTDRTKTAARQFLGTMDPHYYIGVHIRAGGNATSFRDPSRYGSVEDWKAFSDCTRWIQTELARKCGGRVPGVYVASDNNDAKVFLKQQVSDVHTAEVEIYHVDRSNTSLIHNLEAATDAVWADFKILMDATCLVVGRSGFSLLAMHMAPRQPHCAVNFQQCTEASVQEAVQNAQCR